jgi:hypothetical protein
MRSATCSTLGALEEKLLPQRRAPARPATRPGARHRRRRRGGPRLGLIRDESVAARTAALIAAAAAGAVVFRLTR